MPEHSDLEDAARKAWAEDAWEIIPPHRPDIAIRAANYRHERKPELRGCIHTAASLVAIVAFVAGVGIMLMV